MNRPVFTDNKGNVKTIGRHMPKPLTTPVICAEPSPDALQATAAALAGSGSSEKAAAALSVAFSNAEAATSIGLRTQAIQLLRDSYYRLCEAYLNDGIDSISYDVLQRRFQAQITTLLAIEQLTGATRAAQNSVTTQSSSDAGANAAQLSNQLAEARKDLNNLKTEGGALGDEVKKLETPITIPSEPPEAKSKAEKEEEERKAALEAKKAQQQANVAAQEDQVKLIAFLEEAYKEALKQTTKASASGAAQQGTASSGGQNVTSDVANAVRAITLNAINQDYQAQVCFETLRTRNHNNPAKNSVNVKEKFLKYCDDLLSQEVALKRAQAEALSKRTEHLGTIVQAATCKGGCKKPLNGVDARNLILAYDRATPLSPDSRFLQEELTFEDGGSSQSTKGSSSKKTTKSGTRAKTESVTRDDLADLRKQIMEEVGKLAPQASSQGGATSEQEVVTRLKSVTTTTVEGQDVRPICQVNAGYNSTSKACECLSGFTLVDGACAKPADPPPAETPRSQ